jgi:hypothetical protein
VKVGAVAQSRADAVQVAARPDRCRHDLAAARAVGRRTAIGAQATRDRLAWRTECG